MNDPDILIKILIMDY